jgi:hypothetical protein
LADGTDPCEAGMTDTTGGGRAAAVPSLMLVSGLFLRSLVGVSLSSFATSISKSDVIPPTVLIDFGLSVGISRLDDDTIDAGRAVDGRPVGPCDFCSKRLTKDVVGAIEVGSVESVSG